VLTAKYIAKVIVLASLLALCMAGVAGKVPGSLGLLLHTEPFIYIALAATMALLLMLSMEFWYWLHPEERERDRRIEEDYRRRFQS
jgi:hypothetical protein